MANNYWKQGFAVVFTGTTGCSDYLVDQTLGIFKPQNISPEEVGVYGLVLLSTACSYLTRV
jgi:hypothetical protein